MGVKFKKRDQIFMIIWTKPVNIKKSYARIKDVKQNYLDHRQIVMINYANLKQFKIMYTDIQAV